MVRKKDSGTASLTVPDILREHVAELTDALSKAYPMIWPEDGNKFRGAEQPQAIGDVLVDAIHTNLRGVRIGYLFVEKMEGRGKVILAKARSVDDRLRYYAGDERLRFQVDVNWTAWATLNGAQRIAVMDHELSHFLVDINEEGENVYKRVPHDVEEFSSIVRRWGLWKMDLKQFGVAIDKGSQINIFEDNSLTFEAGGSADKGEPTSEADD